MGNLILTLQIPLTKKAHRLVCHGLFVVFGERLRRAKMQRALKILETALGCVRLLVSFLELINTTSCIHQLHLAGEEWMRAARNFEFYQWICLAVNLDGVLCVGSTFGDESAVVAHIFENYKTI